MSPKHPESYRQTERPPGIRTFPCNSLSLPRHGSSDTLNSATRLMARHLRIRNIVKSERATVHEIISAVCGLNPDGTHWTLAQDEAISQIERRISAFYIEGHEGKRFDVTVAMDLRANKYLRATANVDQSDELWLLPNCLHFAHKQDSRYSQAKAGR